MFVVTPTVAQRSYSRHRVHGSELLGRLIEMLINERLYRDLRRTAAMNAGLTALDALSPQILDPGQLAAVKRAIGWEQARRLEVIPIRPLTPLPGTAFSGFFSAGARDAFIKVGMERAQQVLHELQHCS